MTQFASRKGHMTLPVEEGQEEVVLIYISVGKRMHFATAMVQPCQIY
ncbi:hypothetical protein P4S64_15105 [Vibrio sp. M60_M31a]